MAEEKKTAPKQKKMPDKKTEKKAAPNADNKKNDSKAKKASVETPSQNGSFLEYKGKPLVRSGNTVYYGNMNDPYVVCLNIKNSTDLKDIKLSQDVAIQLISTDDTLSPKERIIKNSEKKGFFNALDLGAAWLERQLKKG